MPNPATDFSSSDPARGAQPDSLGPRRGLSVAGDAGAERVAPRMYVFVPGILESAETSWTQRAVEWIHRETGERARTLPYYAGPLTRRFRQGRRARRLEEMIVGYSAAAGFRLVIVGHSNGADIVCRAVRGLPTLGDWSIEHLHLIAPASDADFARNGLGDAIEAGRIGRVTVWYDPGDKALRLGRWTRRLVGWMGLGYGSLGLTGPVIAEDAGEWSASVDRRVYPGAGHSGWFGGAYFWGLMEEIAEAKG